MKSFCLFSHHLYFSSGTEQGYVEIYATKRKKVNVQTVSCYNLFEVHRKCELTCFDCILYLIPSPQKTNGYSHFSFRGIGCCFFFYREEGGKKIFVKIRTLETKIKENIQGMEINPTLEYLNCYENICGLAFMLSIKFSNCKS